MHKPETPGSDFAVKLMTILLWIMIIMCIAAIAFTVIVTVIALVFVLLDINYDWSWML